LFRTGVIFLVLALPARAETFAWVQLGDDSRISARVIAEDGSCPTLTANGAPLAMRVRADAGSHMDHVPDADFGKAVVCEADVAADTTTLVLDDKALPLPPREIHRIVMFGDTGCRIKGHNLQDCNDRDAWPYAKVAARAAETKPDLVIHVGDYAYRESQCPATRNCAGPWGYGFDSWKADFFEPSKPLFQAAAWIMVRGNHEDCVRAGEGWFRFLYHGDVPRACGDLTGFFVVKRPDLGFLVMDNAAAESKKSEDRERIVDLLRDQFHKVAADVPQQTWLLSHRPFNALVYKPASGYAVDNDIQQSAIGRDLPASVRMIVSGHVHIFEALSFSPARPPQLVVGTGGDNLEDLPPQRSAGVAINGTRVSHGLVFARFGYTVWDKDDAGWKGRAFDDNGRVLARCTLEGRNLRCQGHGDEE